MIIFNIRAGLGNKMFQYAAARRLAYIHQYELTLENGGSLLGIFNIQASLATPEDIAAVKFVTFPGGGGALSSFIPQVLELPDNIQLQGWFEDERYFADIADIIRKDFTLKNPLSPVAEAWKNKILSAECAVSMHFRRGDFLKNGNSPQFAVPPLEYYHTAFKQLAEPKSTVFVFSDDIPWCKENLKLDVPTEFVEGCKNYEDLHLMSLCKHNINANSTFSWWGAWLNQNPDKKVFVPIPNTFFNENRLYRGFTPTHYKYDSLDSERWIRIPFDYDKRLNKPLPPKKDTPAPVAKVVPAIDYRDFYTTALAKDIDANDIFSRQRL